MWRHPLLDERIHFGLQLGHRHLAIADIRAACWENGLWIELEHGPSTFERVENLCTAAEAGDIVPLVRLPDGERHHVLRALEVGARIILVPMVDDADYARKVVEYGKYAPVGARGFNTRTPGLGCGLTDPVEAMARANERTHLFTQVETMKSVANIAEILEVDGLSGIFIGPGDLSLNIGKTGQMADPQLRDIVVGCIEKAKAAGKLSGIFTLPNPLLQAAMDAGCDLVVCGGDVMNLGKAWTQLLEDTPTF